MKTKSVKRSNTVCMDIVLESTRQRIIAGEYRLREQLPAEPELQAEWGVSRSVVREAMKVLASQGLVRIEQGRGTFVNEIDSGPIRQQLEWTLLRSALERKDEAALDEWEALLDIRFVLEVSAAERAARHASAADLAAMQSAIAAMRERPEDAEACSEADYDFHLALAQATRNPLWPAILGSLHGLLRRYLELGHHGPDNALQTASEHEDIFNAVREGQGEDSGEAMRHHLQTSSQDLATARRKRGLLFPSSASDS